MILFLVDLIYIENLRISFRLFYSLSFFNFIILCSLVTSIWYQSLTSIRDQVISICFKFLIRDQSFLFVRFGKVLYVTKFINPTTASIPFLILSTRRPSLDCRLINLSPPLQSSTRCYFDRNRCFSNDRTSCS